MATYISPFVNKPMDSSMIKSYVYRSKKLIKGTRQVLVALLYGKRNVLEISHAKTTQIHRKCLSTKPLTYKSICQKASQAIK